jgi:alginate O-acetyltransferase complex protein AlgJ
MERKQVQERTALVVDFLRQRGLAAFLSLVLGAAVALSAVSRVNWLWILPRLPRGVLLTNVTILGTAVFLRLLLAARRFLLYPGKKTAFRMGFMTAIFLGMALLASGILPMRGDGRWAWLFQSADAGGMVIALPLLVFVLIAYLAEGFWLGEKHILEAAQDAARENTSQEAGVAGERYSLARGKVFLLAFLVLLAFPWQGFLQKGWAYFQVESNARLYLWSYDDALAWISNARYRVLGDRLYNNVFASKGDWLVYYGDAELEDQQGMMPFTEKQLASIQKRLDGLSSRLKKQGAVFLVVVVPNKNTIYPEYLPAQLPYASRQTRLDQVVEYQRRNGKTQILDLRPALQEARAERRVYYRLDTHWNAYGAWVAYQEILRALQNDFPSLQPHSLGEYRFVSEGMKNGDLGFTIKVSLAEERFHLEPTFVERSSTRYDVDAAKIQTRITTLPDPGLPRAVIFHDSFLLSLIPFQSDHFRRAVYVRSPDWDEKLIDEEKPDIVIYETAERFLYRLLQLPNP